MFDEQPIYMCPNCHEYEIERQRLVSEVERLRAAIEPFAEIAKGIPDNWPDDNHLRIDGNLGDYEGTTREWLSYHGVNDCADPVLPTIKVWRSLLNHRRSGQSSGGEG